MKKIIFTVLCLLMCSFLFVATFFTQNDEMLEKKTLAEFPGITKTTETGEKSLNFSLLSDLGAWFNDHYAFKPYVVSVDSMAMTKVFKTSGIPTVIYGENGWMYYSSSAPDYMKTDVISNRQAYCIAHNISLVQSYAESRNAGFAFVVPPNKNTLYPDNMPSNYKQGEGKSSLDILKKELKAQKVNYVDLAAAFKPMLKGDLLYLKRDSHWNNKGAFIAYNEILDNLGKKHDTFLTTQIERTKTEYGDLNNMVYPRFGESEWNYFYQIDKNYTLKSANDSVEDGLVTTKSKEGSDNLLMFRDSFANTLIPFFSTQFGSATYSKGQPNEVDALLNDKTDYVVMEIAERNISWYGTNPPLMTGPEVIVEKAKKDKKAEGEINIQSSENDTEYFKIYGSVCTKSENDDRYFVTVNDKTYEAFTTFENGVSDNGFVLYIKKDLIKGDEINVELLSMNDGNYKKITDKTFQAGDIK